MLKKHYYFRTGDKLTVHIEYETSNEASALQWLEPEQTAGKEHPYMFSQCQVVCNLHEKF